MINRSRLTPEQCQMLIDALIERGIARAVAEKCVNDDLSINEARKALGYEPIAKT